MAEAPGCWGWGIVFWTLAWGRVVWSVVDLALDTTYLVTVVYGDEFNGHPSVSGHVIPHIPFATPACSSRMLLVDLSTNGRSQSSRPMYE
jgi:hypothetical protein